MHEMRMLPDLTAASGPHAAVRMLPDGGVEMIAGSGEVVWSSDDPTRREPMGVAHSTQTGPRAECPSSKHQLWCHGCEWDPSWWALAAWAIRNGIAELWAGMARRFGSRTRMDGRGHARD